MSEKGGSCLVGRGSTRRGLTPTGSTHRRVRWFAQGLGASQGQLGVRGSACIPTSVPK